LVAVGALDTGRGDVVASFDTGNALLDQGDDATLAASSIVSVWPSRDLTIRFWPSSLSTMPRMRVGVPAGGVWARAGQTTRTMRAAIAIFRIIQTPVCVSREKTRKIWRTRTRLSPRTPVNGGVAVARFAKQGMEILRPAGAARHDPPRGARQSSQQLETTARYLGIEIVDALIAERVYV
jgi:hypothetical protein